jgi:putative Holliday junction resolvase
MILRLMGIDHGLARIGLAIGDTGSYLARELTIIRRRSKREDFERIGQLAFEHRIDRLVIGLPTNTDADAAFSQADKVQNWAAALQTALPYPIDFWDEQLTSIDAAELARQRRRKLGEPIDDLAARLILQSYLDALREGQITLPSEIVE